MKLSEEVGILRKTLAYVLAIALTVATVSYTVVAQQRSRVDTVRARGKLICGISGATPGFSFPDPTSGRIIGFDADFCNAVAAFLDVPEVEFVNLTSASRIPAVIAGSVDVVFRTTTQTISRDDQIDFGPVTFYDGQRLLVRVGSRIRGLDDLRGARICVHAGTTSERNVSDQLRARGIQPNVIAFQEAAQAFNGLAAGRCDVMTTDASQLTAFRATAPNPGEFLVVGREFSDEPLTPIYQENDSKWADVVNYTVWGMILAEELGIAPHLGKLPDSLSTGERQRVAIGRALAHRPSIVIADEPTASLDPYAAEKIMSLFIQLANEFNTTVILASHAWRHVKELGLRRLAHQTQHLEDGKLTETVVSG